MGVAGAVEWRVAVGDDETSALYEPATSASRAVFVFAHGAGGSMRDRGMTAAANVLREHGFDVVRFNFLYKEKGRGGPDQMPVLKKCIASVVARTREELQGRRPLIIGGRSMGGRAASMLASEGFDCDGLLLLAYPLHPPGKLDQLRDAHLPSIGAPVSCFNGTRDAFCQRELMEAVLKRVGKNFEMHWIDGADHSFHVLKSSGRSDAQVLDEVGVASEAWARKLST
jgi:uncharacterized protein